jgi:hypothetical protein
VCLLFHIKIQSKILLFYQFIMKIMRVKMLKFVEYYIDLVYINNVTVKGFFFFFFFLILFITWRSQREETHFPGNKQRKTKPHKQYDHVIEIANIIYIYIYIYINKIPQLSVNN